MIQIAPHHLKRNYRKKGLPTPLLLSALEEVGEIPVSLRGSASWRRRGNLISKSIKRYKKIKKYLKLTRIIAVIAVITVILPILLPLLTRPRQVEAAWYDDNWAYRKQIPITSHTNAETNRYVSFTVNASDTTKFQADCGDMRYTNASGQLLSYYLASACGASTTVHVLIADFPAGAQSLYLYYGNPTAANGFVSSDFTTEASSYAIGSLGTETQGPGPIAYWKLDEGTGQTVSNSIGSSYNGTLGATSASNTDDPAWQTEDMCISGKCLKFTSSSLQYVNEATSIAGVQTVSFWVKPTSVASISLLVLNGAAGNANLTTNGSGVITADVGFTSPTIYVNGIVSSQLTANKWQYVSVTTGTGITASNVMLGRVNAGYLNGFMDEVKLYPFARSAAQVKTDYLSRGSTKGVAAQIGGDSQKSLSDGLVGYWKPDANCSSYSDLSGNDNNLEPINVPVCVSGKFGMAMDFESSSLDGLNGNDTPSTSITSSLSISAWVKPESNTSSTNFDIATKWSSVDKSYRLVQYGAEIRLYLTSASIYAETSTANLNTGIWYHITGVYNSQNQTAQIYLNGNLMSTSVTGTIPSSIPDGTDGFSVATEGSSTYFYDGVIDNVRLYNRALSPAEIRQLADWAPGPVGWWKMDETSGNAADSSGGGNTLTNNGTTPFVIGKFGNGGSFDGTANQFFSITDASQTNLDITGPITTMGWIKFDAIGVGNMLLAKHTLNDRAYDLVLTAYGSNGAPRFNVSSTGASYDGTVEGNQYSAGTWHHVAGTYDGSYLKIYVDGVLDATPVAYSSGIHNSAGDFQIGTGDTYEYPTDGTIDDVRVYNYARTAKQIVEDMNAGHPAGGSPIGSQVAYWKLDEQQGQTLNNSNSAVALTAVRGTSSSSESTDPSWFLDNSCKLNGCQDFDSSDDVDTITNTTAIDFDLNLASGVTFSAWIDPDTVGEGSSGTIFSKTAGTYCQLGGSTPFNITCSLDLATDATITVNSVIPANTWTHVALTWTDDADDEVTLWINGKNRGSSTNGVGPTSADSSNLLIGNNSAGTATFDGSIDEFKVYNAELSASEILVDMNANSSASLGQVMAKASSEGKDYEGFGGNPPVGWWKMDEKSGTQANDTSGGGYNGTLTNGPTWTTGKVGSAVNFDGGAGPNADVIDLGDQTAFELTTFTLSGWVYRTGACQYSTCPVFAKGMSGNIGYSMELVDSSGYKLRLSIRDGLQNVTGLTTLNANTWYHVAASINGTTVKLYVNGALDNQAGQTQTPTFLTEIAAIGNRNTNLDVTFNGKIDDVRIYNYVLTPAQIAYLYNRGGPVAWYKFDECQGATAYNAVPNTSGQSSGMNGTIYPGDASGDNDTVGTCSSGTTTEMWNDGTNGKFNGSLGFDGTNDYVSIDDATALDSTAYMSLSAWIYTSSSLPSDEGIIMKRVNTSEYWQYGFAVSSNSLYWLQSSSGTGWETMVSTSTLPSSGTWHHLVGTNDGTNARFYVDGREVGTADSSPATSLAASTAGLTIGEARVASVDNYFTGLIDDVRIYNYALTADQVKKVTNEGSAFRWGPITGTP